MLATEIFFVDEMQPKKSKIILTVRRLVINSSQSQVSLYLQFLCLAEV